MRKILIILILISGFAKAQTPPRTGYLVQPAKWKFVNPVWLDSGMYITKIAKNTNQLRHLTYDSSTGKVYWDYVRAGSSGTVTSVSALTLGTSGTDLSSTVANSTTTPVITLNVPTASATNRGALSSTDWSTFNNKLSTSTAASTYLPLAGGTMTGNLLFTDNTYDIGASGATRPRTGYFGTSVGIGVSPSYALDVLSSTTGTAVAGQIKNGTAGWKFGSYVGGYAAFWPASVTPSTLNYTILSAGSQTNLNSTGSLYFMTNDNTMGQWTTTGLCIAPYPATPRGAFTVPSAPSASPNFGLVSRGSGNFTGTGVQPFAGAAGGTVDAINTAANTAANFADWQHKGSLRYQVDSTGKTSHQYTYTAGGTTGNQTINKPTGSVNIAAAGTTVTVTNSTVTANSIVTAVIMTNDATAQLKSVVVSAGSFIINIVACTAETKIGFIVTN